MKTFTESKRLVGVYGDQGQGTLLVLVCAIHGNEPAGIEASRRVLAQLQRSRPPINGRVVSFIGNLTALKKDRRFIDRDMNRIWLADEILGQNGSKKFAENVERRHLLRSIEAELNDHRGQAILVDLHSTSGDAVPFCIINDTLRNRRVALSLSIPIVLGLEEAIEGTIQDYFGDRGLITMAVEGGSHRGIDTADNLESVIWHILVAAGLLAAADAPELKRHHRRLEGATRGLPTAVEVFYRRGLEEKDRFRMTDGLGNFSPVQEGQLVGTDQEGSVRAPKNGLVVLPNYQGQGDDAYFLGRRVRMIWLRISAVIRHLGLDRLLPLLPGISRHRDDPKNTLVADQRVARYLALKIFHLFGYRRYYREGHRLIFRRRAEG